MIKIHLLKTEHNYFIDKLLKKKTFTIRKNDRDYSLFDKIIFYNMFEFAQTNLQNYNIIEAEIKYICKDSRFLKSKYICIQLTNIVNKILTKKQFNQLLNSFKNGVKFQ